MCDTLVRDVQHVILRKYAQSHTPLWSQVCKQWFLLFLQGDGVNRGPLWNHCTLVQLASDGYLTSLQCVRSRQRQGTWRQSLLKNLVYCAAQSGREAMLRWCWDEYKQVLNLRLPPDIHPYMHADQQMQVANMAMARAARSGHKELVCVCQTEFGATDVDLAMANAARGGHMELMQFCHDVLGAFDVSTAMGDAARKGHEDIVRFCHDTWDATPDVLMLNNAVANGFTHIARLFFGWIGALNVGLTDFVMASAARNGHEGTMRLCHDEWGASNVNNAMCCAASSGHTDLVRICYDEWGATNIEPAIEIAIRHGHVSVVRLLRKQESDGIHL